ncbi:MAG: peptide-methionine (R)-S-oxide reductase MsrB [Candidatus Levybacteria bacterium]|nr:peptide-methionine (R)-S-oxide reductase MsrB [Candidatus Levybacteria bacterium]
MSDMQNKSEEYWKEKLTPEQYHILREKGTEPAFTGKYVDNHESGMYECAACGHPLFSSDTKFESGSGWPSFDQPVNRENVELHEDGSFFMKRTEVTCKNCGAHLGHVFPDGPKETTGERYCINSCSLNFKAKE